MRQYTGRKKPYTQIGIRRKKCACGKQAVHQWSACANIARWVPVCGDCDIKINAAVLEIMQIPNWRELLDKYIKKERSRLTSES